MTPAYGIKHWWRDERLPGEPLKAFARRFASYGKDNRPVTTTAKWFTNKGMPPRPRVRRSDEDGLE